ncbi:uncharacterized protein PFL1_00566 [Pseudozyma flocculosa PF-1]|uniref:Uncharacterized protein n=1 Tax=Pseudozyma flocculosa TaxID=84751 RepID=A0A5C3ER29_9BASI|nr:uncharacterized protein PFL1_00566 [Pseudozyma flocculosa PF-1]EPQ32370.1 hypothetical protein PFL1_00566 [Pseudozyma flocculosa PF-1]SPO34658.1 uncharacterized protein PSFLO_00129 [Pseudozyma flocculosa]
MSLEPGSLFSVSLPHADSPPSSSSPPAALQLRLTEHALTQLAAALCPDGVHVDPSKLPPDLLRLDLGSASSEAALLIGPSRLPLQRSSEAAPHELFRLNHNETHLTRIATVTQKLSVRPSHVTAGAASRLKERQEEEDLRKERKRAVVVDQPINAAKLRQQRGSGIKPSAIGASALSRSSSLSKVSLIRQESRPDRHASMSPLRGRESLPQSSSAVNSPIFARQSTGSLQSSPEAKAASFGSSQRSRMEPDRLHLRHIDAESGQESGHSDNESITSIPKSRSSALERQTSGNAGASGSTAGAAAATAPAKKGGKLTTRQRLAKAAKGGSKPLVDADKRASATAATRTAAKAVTGSASRLSADVESQSSDARLTQISKSRTEAAKSVLPASQAKTRASVPVDAISKDPSRSSVRLTSSSQKAPPTKAEEVKEADVERRSQARSSKSPTRPAVEPPLKRRRAEAIEDPAKDGVEPPAPRTAASVAREARQPAGGRDEPSTSTARKALTSLPDAGVPSPAKKQRRLSPAQSSQQSRAGPPPPGPPPGPPPTKASTSGPPTASALHSRAPSRSPSPHIPLLPTVKGVGPGAAHWLEPWLDVRSRSDWHHLAARFSKTCDEYAVNKRRLDEERARLDREWSLATREEAEASQGGGGGGLMIVMDEDGGDEATHQIEPSLPPASTSRPHVSPPPIPTSAAPSSSSLAQAAPPRESPEEGMLEEGEMTAEPEPEAQDAAASASMSTGTDGSQDLATANARSDATSRTRSATPEDNLVWRSEGTSRSTTVSPPLSRPDGTGSGHDGRTGASGTAAPPPPPLPFKELEALAERHRELHGSLMRMQAVLVESKGRF